VIAEVPLDLADDRRQGVSGEREAATDVEAVDRLEEPQTGDLVDVLERLARARVSRGELSGERQETPDDRVAIDRVVVIGEPLEQPTIGGKTVSRRSLETPM
jgi:hypothetical protein